jgi:glycogen synthase
MNILFLCNEYPPGPHGGIGTSTQVLSRALIARNHTVWVLGIYKSTYPAPKFEVDQGVQVWRLRQFHLPKFGWLIDRWRIFRMVRKLVRSEGIELIDVPDYDGWAAGWGKLSVPVNARLCGSASVIYANGFISRNVSDLSFYLEKLSLLRADYYCSKSRCLSEETQQVFQLPAIEQSPIVYNPVKISDFPVSTLPLTRLNLTVVFAGTLTENKGVRSLIKAWSIVQKRFPEAELHLYGKDGRTHDEHSLRRELEEYIYSTSLNNVIFHGQVDRQTVINAFSSARLAVFPSYREGFSNVVLESMVCGCPTIFTSHSSGPEVIEHGKDGLLVDPDSPAEIADLILRLLEDNVLAERLGQNGREKVHSLFSLDRIVELNETHFQSCIKSYQKSL